MFFLIKKPAWLDIAKTREMERARRYEIGMKGSRTNTKFIKKDDKYYLKVGDKWLEMKGVGMKELMVVKDGVCVGVVDEKWLLGMVKMDEQQRE
ncbi:hypothetical protein THOM_1542 [Trachipleistophora hominis]|uniref:Uncharacterized protein n=1 Tax=Trachipleistophora hominis TaxID=72359 RepID=L7JXL7_TRAHO|nr:hypothetical protein THOM_1542 [Trachipleistophora hominis]